MGVKKVGKFGFEKSKRELPAVKRRIGILVARNSEKFFRDNFDRQGFKDKTLERWRKSRKERGKTLIESGSLRRSINAIVQTFEKIIIETGADIDYGRIHNDGGRAGRGGRTELPQRKFIGNSEALNNENEKIILRELKKIV